MVAPTNPVTTGASPRATSGPSRAMVRERVSSMIGSAPPN
jgi:hypothetical protein